jgi:hypothetical protein
MSSLWSKLVNPYNLIPLIISIQMFRLLHCISIRLTSQLYQVEIKTALLVEVSLAQLEGGTVEEK